MKRRFALQPLLNLRVATEEQQKRRVQLASISVSRSTQSRNEAERWIASLSDSIIFNSEPTTQAEICFTLDCIAAGKRAMAEHALEHRRLVELLECEIKKLDVDHRRTATMETLRDQHLHKVKIEDRRLEQLSLDESFRLSANSSSGISDTISTQD